MFLPVSSYNYRKMGSYNTRRNLRKRTFGHVCRAKIQISLLIRADCSESSLSSFWIAKDEIILHADNKDSDPTARKSRLIFVGRTCPELCFLTFRLIWFPLRLVWFQLWFSCIINMLTPLSYACVCMLHLWRLMRWIITFYKIIRHCKPDRLWHLEQGMGTINRFTSISAKGDNFCNS